MVAEGRRRARRPAMLGAHPHATTVELDLDRAVEVGPVDQRRRALEPLDDRRRWVAIVVVGADRDQGHGRVECVDEGRRGRAVAAVMADLEHIHRSEPAGHDRCLDVGFDVAGQEEPPPGSRA
jgi:hypothetical protein